jgi:ABC-type multidrug transport system fused ATPase/permease subunit
MIFDVIERVPEIRNIDEPVYRFTCRISIQFNNITFKYPTAPIENRPVLENASFTVRAG